MKHNIFMRGISCAAVLAVVLMTAPAAFAQEAECPDDVYVPIPEWVKSFTIDGSTIEYNVAGQPEAPQQQEASDSDFEPHAELEAYDDVENDTDTDDDFDYDLETFAAEVFKYTNIIREENGLLPFKSDSTLTTMAQTRMNEEGMNMSHERPNGSTPDTIFLEYDTDLVCTGENIGGAGGTPENMARGFMQTSHRQNVLNEDAEYLGIGVSWVDTIIGKRISVLQLFAKD